MLLSELYRVSIDNQWVVITQSEKKIFDGFFRDAPVHLLDCTIKKVKPSYNGYVDVFVIDLNE